MGLIKGLAGDTIWYGLSSIIGRLISYLLVPLYTIIFLPGEYGIVTELYAYTAFLFPVFNYGMETAYFRFATKNKEKEPYYFNITVSALLVSSAMLGVLLIWFSQSIAVSLEYSGKVLVFYWLITILIIDTLSAIPFARLRLQKKAKKFAFIRLFNISLAVFMNLFFLVFCLKIYQGIWFPSYQGIAIDYFDFQFKAKYVFLSNLIANSVMLILLYKEFSGFKFKINFSQLKPILIYALPLLFMGLAGVTNEMLSRALLKFWLPDGFYADHTSLAALGIFGACYKLSVFMMLGIQAFRYAAEPFFFSNAEDKDSPKLFANVMTGFVIFNVLIFVGVSLNLEVIGMVFLRNPVYREGLYIVPFLLMGYLFNGIYYNLSVWYKITDRTIYGAFITITGAVLTVVFNYWLIPILGYFGSAIITLISFFAMAVISYLLGQKYYPVPYQIKRIFVFLLVSTLLVALVYPLDLGHWSYNFLLKNAAVIVFLVFTYLMERKHLAGRVIFGFKFP